MSEDPKLFDGGDYNLFRYCHNDPIDFTDPMGLASEIVGITNPRQESFVIAAERMTIAERISLGQKSMESSIGGDRAVQMLHLDRQLAMNSRPLTSGEVRLGKSKFGSAINYRDTAVVRGAYLPFARTMSPNGKMYYPGLEYSPDFSRELPALQSKFIHEMTHVFQYQGLGYGTAALAAAHIFHGQYKYLPVKNPDRPFFNYGIEQQAMIMQDYFRLEHGLGPMDASGPADAQPPIQWYQNISPFTH
jgi:hypothetical protein